MTTLILNGGLSSRMGRAKGTIVRPDGQRQIEWLAQLVGRTGCEVVLSMRDHSPPPVDLPAIIDLHPGAGPLAALAAFHAFRSDEPVLMLGGDLFLMDEETIRNLLEHRDPERGATAYANRIDGRPEPLCAIYEVSGISRAAEWLARGDFHARHFLESLDPRMLELPSPAALDSVNTTHDLAECFAKLRQGVRAKSVEVRYVGPLREARGLERDPVETLACTIAGLYEELRFQHHLPLEIQNLRAARNGEPCAWGEPLADGDQIAFTPPSAEG